MKGQLSFIFLKIMNSSFYLPAFLISPFSLLFCLYWFLSFRLKIFFFQISDIMIFATEVISPRARKFRKRKVNNFGKCSEIYHLFFCFLLSNLYFKEKNLLLTAFPADSRTSGIWPQTPYLFHPLLKDCKTASMVSSDAHLRKTSQLFSF